MNDMIELIRNRRTIRRYRDEQIRDDELQQILEAGLCAPSAGGMQRVKIAAVQNREITDTLGKRNAAAMKLKKAGHVSSEQPSIIDDPSIRSGFYGAPTVCVIFNQGSNTYSIADSFCAAENILLAASSLGIGSAIIGRAEETFDCEYGRDLMKEWEIPEDYTARCFVILGYIDGPYPSMKQRKDGRLRVIR